MLNDVKFDVAQGGLGIVAPGEDHISAILWTATIPAALNNIKAKAYVAIEQVVQDGITESSAIYGELYYHASEFFRISPGATLWLCFNVNSPNELMTLTNGKVRQLATYVSNMADIQSVWQTFATVSQALHAPLQVLLGWNATFNPATCDDLSLKQSNCVSVLIAGSGAGKAVALATALGKAYIPCIGAVLGSMSKAKVSDSIAWVENHNLSNGKELEVIRIADGSNNPSNALLTQLDDKHYLVLRKHVGESGTYLNDSLTCIDPTNDYYSIEHNRVIQKARRGIRKALLPKLNSPVRVDNATGKLASSSVTFFENLAGAPLAQMLRDSEMSGYTVYIDPAQNIVATSILNIQVRITPMGVARNIVVNLGFAVVGF